MLCADGTPHPHRAGAVEGLTLRRLRAEDIDEIYQIECASFSDAYKKETLQRELQNRISYYVTARINGTAAGYAGIWCIADEAEVISVAVAPAFRRRGIAAELMAELLRHCADMGIKTVRLEVRQSNTPAQKLYEKFGFRAYGVRESYYADGENAILMLREDKDDNENTGD